MSFERSPTATKHGILSFFNSRREEIIEKQYYEIKQLESQYKKLYEESPVMKRTVSREGVILNCNQAYAQSLGYSSKEEIIGHSIFEHTPEEFMAAKRESFEEWRLTGTVKNKEVWLKRKDGSKFPGLISANNLHDEKGDFVGSNTVIIDITEIFEARRLQGKATEEIRRTYEMRENFLNLAAHELRTPIQPILGSTELVQKGVLKPEAAILGIRESAIRLRDIANDILAVSRIESGNLAYEMQTVKAHDIIDEVANYARLTIQSYGKGDCVTLLVNTPETTAEDRELHIDRGRVVQALENVLHNSIKFTEKGQVAIETAVLGHKGLFEIKISDEGRGIPLDILPRLFDKFVTKTNCYNANDKGTGLGLFITKSIIQAHGGDIFGYNNEGSSSGATFVIRLPIAGATPV